MTTEVDDKNESDSIRKECWFERGEDGKYIPIPKSKGSAGFNLSLSDSVITMEHSEDKTILFQFNATQGDWVSICDYIRSLGKSERI
jgi:hypothetical protein